MTGSGVLIGCAGTRLGTGATGLTGGTLGGACITGLIGTIVITFITTTAVVVSTMRRVPVLPVVQCLKV